MPGKGWNCSVTALSGGEQARLFILWYGKVGREVRYCSRCHWEGAPLYLMVLRAFLVEEADPGLGSHRASPGPPDYE